MKLKSSRHTLLSQLSTLMCHIEPDEYGCCWKLQARHSLYAVMLLVMLGPVARLLRLADADLRSLTEYPGLDRSALVPSLVRSSYPPISRTKKQYCWNLQVSTVGDGCEREFLRNACTFNQQHCWTTRPESPGIENNQ